jgi:hypothetical protein
VLTCNAYLTFIIASIHSHIKKYYLELHCASEDTLSRLSRLHLQSLAPINPHLARVEHKGPFSLCIIHKKGLGPSSGDINGLMMIGNTQPNTIDIFMQFFFTLRISNPRDLLRNRRYTDHYTKSIVIGKKG